MIKNIIKHESDFCRDVPFWFAISYDVDSVEVILRAEAVEMAQAGDRCDFVGTLIVVPDVSSLSMPGS